MEALALTPDLSVLLEWSAPMQDFWWAQYPDLMMDRPGLDEQQLQEYNDWDRKRDIAYRHIQRFFKVTGSLPIAGDLLQVLDEGLGKCGDLYIKSRRILTSPVDEKVRVIYQLQSEYTEVLESCNVKPTY